jgi:hypothetical protein
MYACYFPIVFAESTPEECPFPVLESAWGSLVGDLDDYLHFLKIDEESHEWKNFLIRIRAKISTKRVLPKVLHPSKLIGFCQENNLWDYLNCDLFIFMVDELLKEEGKFPATKDSIQKRRKRLLEDKSAYIKKYEEEVNTMLEENKDQKNIITPPAGCLTAQMKCNDLKFTLNRLINLKKFLVQVIGVNEVRFYGIERGSIEFFFFMVPKFAVDVEALRSVLSVSNAQLSKACDQLGIVEFHVFVPVPQVVSRKYIHSSCTTFYPVCSYVQCRYCRNTCNLAHIMQQVHIYPAYYANYMFCTGILNYEQINATSLVNFGYT